VDKVILSYEGTPSAEMDERGTGALSQLLHNAHSFGMYSDSSNDSDISYSDSNNSSSYTTVRKTKTKGGGGIRIQRWE